MYAGIFFPLIKDSLQNTKFANILVTQFLNTVVKNGLTDSDELSGSGSLLNVNFSKTKLICRKLKLLRYIYRRKQKCRDPHTKPMKKIISQNG